MSWAIVMLVQFDFDAKRIMPQDEECCKCSVWTMCGNSWLTRLALIFYCPSIVAW